MKHLLITCLSALCILSASATERALVPAPQSVIEGSETFAIGPNLNVYAACDSLKPEARYLAEWLASKNTASVACASTKAQKGGVNLSISSDLTGREQYTLEVTRNGISIVGGTREGVFRGITTLMQLIVENPQTLTTIKIQDAPRFEYRALMLDPARHFIPVADVKKYIDEMARYKYNFLHFHLSDDQGWRVEIKKYPLLTQIGSKRAETDGDGTPHEGFYTQDQLREMVAYAAARHIEIIPEIDVPGHSVAAITAYPHLTCADTTLTVRTTAGVSKNLLCAGNEKVFEMYSEIYQELCNIFPSKYFHMGGDEAPLDEWSICPKCQAVKKAKNLTTNQELMSYFFNRLSQVLEKNGRTPLFWYELDVPSYPAGTVTYAWRNGLTPSVINRARELGCKVICAPGEHAYFDYPHRKGDHPVINWGMPNLPLEDVYKLDPGYGLPTDQQSHVMGVEATLWSECIKNLDRTFYMTYPRAMALAEAGWSNMEARDWESFKRRIRPHVLEMAARGVNVRLPYEEFKTLK